MIMALIFCSATSSRRLVSQRHGITRTSLIEQKQLVPSGKSPVRQKAMEEEQAQAEAMSEEREEGRVPEERAQAAQVYGPPVHTSQDISLRFKILEREKVIVGGCFWATLANIFCADEHEKQTKTGILCTKTGTNGRRN